MLKNLIGLGLAVANHLVNVEQFAMSQCPMTSTWFNAFQKFCLIEGTIMPITNFSQSMVGGTSGGAVTEDTWNSSFHGYQEVVGDMYFLCARQHEDVPSLSMKYQWTNFVSCMNGDDGLVGIALIPGNARRCAEATLGSEKADILDQCVSNEDEGLRLFHDAVFRTSDLGVKYDAPELPVIRINGKEYKGLEAYYNLGERICDAYDGNDKPENCGCTEEYNKVVASIAM